jgi:hypothetical protein
VGISDRGGPEEALEERLAYEGTQHRVVTTHTRVDVAEELATLGDGDTSLQDAERGVLV